MKQFLFRVESRRKGDRSRNAWKHLGKFRTRLEVTAYIAQRKWDNYEFRVREA